MVEPAVDYDGCTPDERCSAIDSLAGLHSGVHAEILRIVAAANRAEDWKADGATSVAAWLACRYNLSTRTAHDWARVADALEELPLLRAAFVSGVVSFEQLRWVVLFATAADDRWLADTLPWMNVAQVKALSLARKPVPDNDAAKAHHRRNIRLRPDGSGLGSRLSGFLPNEQAATVEEALRRRAEQMGADDSTGEWAPYGSRCADALNDLCADDLAAAADGSSHPDASVVVIHVGADVAEGAREGNGTIDGQPITATAVQRRLCDTKIEFNIHDPDGTTVGIGRRSRAIPSALSICVRHRDGHCCRWPGCRRRIRHLHHMSHWANGGATNSSNLIGVCWFHHHLLHEGGWNATGNADDSVTFTSPTGRTIESRAGPPIAA